MDQKETEVRETRLRISRWRLRSLPADFNAVVAGTPFEGSRLVFTGKHWGHHRNDRGEFSPSYYEFAVIPTIETYEPIPGFRFSGYVSTEDGGEQAAHGGYSLDGPGGV